MTVVLVFGALGHTECVRVSPADSVTVSELNTNKALRKHG